MKAILPWLSLAVGIECAALEARDAQGLDVTIERLSEPVMVDGVVLRVQSATGPEVPALAARIEARWRQEGGPLREHTRDGWNSIARFEHGRNEVIQWRGQGDSAQLLHSLLDAMQRPQRPSAAPFRLPSGCRWIRTIEGRAGQGTYQQHSAHCRAEPATVLEAIGRQLRSSGWIVHAGTTQVLRVSGAGLEAELIVVPGPSRAGSGVVWVASHPDAGSPR